MNKLKLFSILLVTVMLTLAFTQRPEVIIAHTHGNTYYLEGKTLISMADTVATTFDSRQDAIDALAEWTALDATQEIEIITLTAEDCTYEILIPAEWYPYITFDDYHWECGGMYPPEVIEKLKANTGVTYYPLLYDY